MKDGGTQLERMGMRDRGDGPGKVRPDETYAAETPLLEINSAGAFQHPRTRLSTHNSVLVNLIIIFVKALYMVAAQQDDKVCGVEEVMMNLDGTLTRNDEKYLVEN